MKGGATSMAAALLLLISISCRVEEDENAQLDSWHEIYTAIDYKSRECGSQPSFLLYVPEDPSSYGTRLCSLSILQMECPFHEYPITCLELYRIDLPGFGP